MAISKRPPQHPPSFVHLPKGKSDKPGVIGMSDIARW
jgi:hypothetical protein